MVKDTVFCLEIAGFGQGVGLAAMVTGEIYAFAFHFAFGQTMGALIQHPVQKVSTEGLVDHDLVFLLPAEIIKGKGFFQLGIQFRHGHGCDLFFGQQAGHIHTNLDFTQLQTVVQRISLECALGDHGDHGNVQLFQQYTHFSGEGGGCAVKGITGLREHENAGFLFLQHVLHIPDQAHIADKFLGGDAAHPMHEPAQTHHSVGGADNAVTFGEEQLGSDLQIRETGVIHQDQTGFFLADFLHAVLAADKPGGDAQKPNKPLENSAGSYGVAMLGTGQSADFFVRFLFDFNIHKLVHFHHFFLQLMAANQESTDGEQSGNTGHTSQIAPGIVMGQNNMTGDSHRQHFQNAGGGGVDEHTHKLQTDHHVQNVV